MSVKIKSIDKQHQRLFDLINDFYANIDLQSNNDLILKLVHGMKNYTIFHFNEEEDFMKQNKYENYEEHKKEHQEFINKVLELEKKIQSGKIIVSYEITSFLKDWIKKHILSTDMKYSDFFIKHGAV
jgi:hemerythrin